MKYISSILAALLLLILLPLLVVIAIVVYLGIGHPVIFSQTRPGLQCRPFKLWKFRTMKEAYSADGKPLADHLRMTRVGSFLRSTSLDELPTLVNVLRGDMGFIGPRPLLMEYVPLYTREQARRHDVRPGITGWAQVNGRNALAWEDKFLLDVWYVDNRSFTLNCRIIYMTIMKVLKKDGISAANHVTISKFTGSSETPAQDESSMGSTNTLVEAPQPTKASPSKELVDA